MVAEQMEAFRSVLSWPRVLATIAVYLASLVIYRLFFHPLARFPGPRLAAVTRYYEGYYDLWLNGQYTFKIAQLHKQYGPIIRISPHELHVSDPAFFDTLYRHDGVWHKYAWAVNAFAAQPSTIFQADHHIHKARRQAINSFFAKPKAVAHVGMIEHYIETLCGRLSAFSPKETFDLGAAIGAVTRDIANDFIIGKSYDSLGKDDFDVAMVVTSQGGGGMWRIGKFVRWFPPVLKSIPPERLAVISDTNMKQFMSFLTNCMKDTRAFMATVDSPSPDDKSNIVHEIMRSKLPASEKTFNRLFEEVGTSTGAGFETTASVMRIVIFNIYHDANILRQLRTELSEAAKSQPSGKLDLKTLEHLPYLTAVLMEGLRLNPAIATRMARVAPDRDLFYKDQRIPAGTPVGMTSILIHTDETYYPEPNSFQPGRWMDPDPWHIGEKPFHPFSKGTRICVGMHLAWAELYLTVATLVQRFNFDFPVAKPEDFLCSSDQFIIGTSGRGVLKAHVSRKKI